MYTPRFRISSIIIVIRQRKITHSPTLSILSLGLNLQSSRKLKISRNNATVKPLPPRIRLELSKEHHLAPNLRSLLDQDPLPTTSSLSRRRKRMPMPEPAGSATLRSQNPVLAASHGDGAAFVGSLQLQVARAAGAALPAATTLALLL